MANYIEKTTYLLENGYGCKEWYQYGKLHRENDLPAVETSIGSMEWYLHGKLHRSNGPAVEQVDGYKAWYLNGVQVPEF